MPCHNRSCGDGLAGTRREVAQPIPAGTGGQVAGGGWHSGPMTASSSPDVQSAAAGGTATGAPRFAPRPGGWGDAEQVAEYVARMETLPPRAAGEAMLVDLLPEKVTRVLDLGTGDGRLVARVLDARPAITHAVAVDRSEPMLERARRRFADDDRVTVTAHDLTADVGMLGEAFDVVVSGFAIHHLEHDRKRELFGEVRRILRPDGLFANLEVVESATPRLHAEFLRLISREDGDPEDRLAPVDAQLRWMEDAGLVDVDCLWRWRGFAVLAGRAPAGE